MVNIVQEIIHVNRMDNEVNDKIRMYQVNIFTTYKITVRLPLNFLYIYIYIYNNK